MKSAELKALLYGALLAGFNAVMQHAIELFKGGWEYKDVLGLAVFFLGGAALFLKGKYEEKPEKK